MDEEMKVQIAAARPGDLVVVTMPRYTTQDRFHVAQRALSALIPEGATGVVLMEPARLEVVRPEQGGAVVLRYPRGATDAAQRAADCLKAQGITATILPLEEEVA